MSSPAASSGSDLRLRSGRARARATRRRRSTCRASAAGSSARPCRARTRPCGSLVRSSHAIEYSVSKLTRTTSFMSAGGYAGTLTNMFIGPLPNSLPGWDVRRLLARDVHRDERVEVEVRIHSDPARDLLGQCGLPSRLGTCASDNGRHGACVCKRRARTGEKKCAAFAHRARRSDMDRGWWPAWISTSIATPRRCGPRASIRLRRWCSRSRRPSWRCARATSTTARSRRAFAVRPGADAAPARAAARRERRSSSRCGARRCGARRGDARLPTACRCAAARRRALRRSAVLPRTRWVDELVHRYVFEREVCERHGEQGGAVPRGRADEGDVLPRLRAARSRARASSVAVRGRRGGRRGARVDRGAPVRAVHGSARSSGTATRASRPCCARSARSSASSPLAYLRRRRLEESDAAARVGALRRDRGRGARRLRESVGVRGGVSRAVRRRAVARAADAAGRRAAARARRAADPTAAPPRLTARTTARARASRASSAHADLTLRLRARPDRELCGTPIPSTATTTRSPTRPSTTRPSTPHAGRAHRLALAGALPRDPRPVSRRRSRATTTRPTASIAANPKRFHGGDFEGLRQNLGYVRDLGATAIWITPAEPPGRPAAARVRLSRLLDRLRRSGRRRARSPSSAAPTSSRSSPPTCTRPNMRFVLDMVVNHAGDTRAAAAPAPRLVPRSRRPAVSSVRRRCTARSTTIPTSRRSAPRSRRTCRRSRPTRSRATTSTASAWTPPSTCLPAYFHDSFFPAVRGGAARPVRRRRGLRAGLDRDVRAVPRRRASTRRSTIRSTRRSSTRSATAARPIGSRRRSPTASRRVGADRALDLVLFVDNHDVPRFANEPGLRRARGRDPPAAAARARSDLHAAGNPAALLRRRARHVRRRRSRQPPRPAGVGDRPGGARAAASGRGGRGRGARLRARPEAVGAAPHRARARRRRVSRAVASERRRQPERARVLARQRRRAFASS